MRRLTNYRCGVASTSHPYFMRLASGLVVVVALLLTASCGVQQHRPFTFINSAEPESLDPGIITGLPEGRLVDMLFEGLTRYHPKTLEPVPGVALRWQVSADNKTYRFFLRPAFWADGVPITAADFIYSWKRVLTAATAADYVYLMFPIKNAKRYFKQEITDFDQVGIHAIDSATLEVTLENPTPYFLDLTSFSTYLPVPRHKINALGDKWARPDLICGNGPYVVREWKINHRLVFVKNPRYWDTNNVRLTEVVALTITDLNAGFNVYETGGADLITSVPLNLVDQVRSRADFHSRPTLGTYFYRFNVTRPPFDDVNFRRALSSAIDRSAITEKISRGGQVPAEHLVPPGMVGYQSPAGFAFNAERARAYLQKSSYAKMNPKPKIKILYNTSEGHRHIAEVIQQNWKQNLDVEVELENQEWKVYLNTTNALAYDVARSSWIGDYNDPTTFLEMFVTGGGNNRTGWSRAEYDTLLSAAEREKSPRRRNHILQQAEALLLDDAPIAPIYFYVSSLMYRERVKGIFPNVRSYLSFQDMSLSK